MSNKVTFYGYFFGAEHDSISAYDILRTESNNFVLKTCSLDLEFRNQGEDIIIMVYEALSSCLAAIIGRLRNSEIEAGLYRPLQPLDELPENYRPLIEELEGSIIDNHTACISIFGNLNKYKPQTAAKDMLNNMGYMTLNTRPPHLYLLEDYIQQELLTQSNPVTRRSSR